MKGEKKTTTANRPWMILFWFYRYLKRAQRIYEWTCRIWVIISLRSYVTVYLVYLFNYWRHKFLPFFTLMSYQFLLLCSTSTMPSVFFFISLLFFSHIQIYIVYSYSFFSHCCLLVPLLVIMHLYIVNERLTLTPRHRTLPLQLNNIFI